MAEGSKLELWQVYTPYLTAGLYAREGIVIEAAPILSWTVGKSISVVRAYAVGKRGHIRKVGGE